jgi:hypothetical protein
MAEDYLMPGELVVGTEYHFKSLRGEHKRGRFIGKDEELQHNGIVYRLLFDNIYGEGNPNNIKYVPCRHRQCNALEISQVANPRVFNNPIPGPGPAPAPAPAPAPIVVAPAPVPVPAPQYNPDHLPPPPPEPAPGPVVPHRGGKRRRTHKRIPRRRKARIHRRKTNSRK